jgi:transcriptional regulator with XRE-family HTH domain
VSEPRLLAREATDTGQRPAFGALLRHYRLVANLTQEELAERSGLSLRGISDLERGARRAPQPETLRLLAKGLRLADEDRRILECSVDRHRGPVRAAQRRTPRSAVLSAEERVAHCDFADEGGDSADTKQGVVALRPTAAGYEVRIVADSRRLQAVEVGEIIVTLIPHGGPTAMPAVASEPPEADPKKQVRGERRRHPKVATCHRFGMLPQSREAAQGHASTVGAPSPAPSPSFGPARPVPVHQHERHAPARMRDSGSRVARTGHGTFQAKSGNWPGRTPAVGSRLSTLTSTTGG